MIDLKELRVGNYINGFWTDEDDQHYQACIVETIDNVDSTEYDVWVSVHGKPSKNRSEVEVYDHFEGIPITSGIKINGQNPGGIVKVQMSEDMFFRGAISRKGFCIALDERNAFGHIDTISGPTFKYVHELQNWYYWNSGKKELEIKLK